MMDLDDRRPHSHPDALHVEHSGQGPTVVLLHPGALDLTVWDELAASLARDHHVVRFDARSHGRSTTSVTDHSPVQDLMAVLDALGVDRAHLVGCSMGGMTAVEAAVTTPERVASLVLLGAEVWPDDHGRDTFVTACHDRLAAAIADRDGGAWVETMVRLSCDGPDRAPDQVDPQVRARVRSLLERAVREHAAATGQPQWDAVRDRLDEVRAATTVAVGEHEARALHETAAHLAEHVAGARQVVVPDVGHLSMLEAPGRVEQLVRDHLAGSAVPADPRCGPGERTALRVPVGADPDDRRALSCGVVLRVREDECDVRCGEESRTVRYATGFPTPRTERVQPGNLVALAEGADGIGVVLWRWYDAVVLAEEPDGVRLWEPCHGEVLASPRPSYAPQASGRRAYLSAGLPGADWWVAGPTVADTREARVDLEEVERLYSEHDLWDTAR